MSTLKIIVDEATEVRFGPVYATRWEGTKWCVFDSRPVRQGARMVANDLPFDEAVAAASRLAKDATPNCLCGHPHAVHKGHICYGPGGANMSRCRCAKFEPKKEM